MLYTHTHNQKENMKKMVKMVTFIFYVYLTIHMCANLK